MKIVQTLWSGNKDLMTDGFGWITPQHHLMAWALSCLKLKEHYSEVHLYTDTIGHSVFAEALELPYTEIHIAYDKFPIELPEYCWAYPKLLTYAAQQQPFIHVDGDVFVWEKFSSQLESSRLLAQNAEQATQYYQGMIKDMCAHASFIPNVLRHRFERNIIPSFNAGIVGGSALAFFGQLEKLANELIDKNRCVNSHHLKSPNLNILFEQILFGSLAQEANIDVACLFEEQFDDVGYFNEKIADFSDVPFGKKYLHIIGRKKTIKELCSVMSRVLLKEYPEYYLRIIRLFEAEHKFFTKELLSSDSLKFFLLPLEHCAYLQSCSPHSENTLPLEAGQSVGAVITETEELPVLEQYKAEKERIAFQLAAISNQSLLAFERRSLDYFGLFTLSAEQQREAVLKTHEHLAIIEKSFEWTSENKEQINSELAERNIGQPVGLAIVPQLLFDGMTEVVIDELDYNILQLLDEGGRIEYLIEELKDCFDKPTEAENSILIREIIVMKLKRLLLTNCIFLLNKDQSFVQVSTPERQQL